MSEPDAAMSVRSNLLLAVTLVLAAQACRPATRDAPTTEVKASEPPPSDYVAYEERSAANALQSIEDNRNLHSLDGMAKTIDSLQPKSAFDRNMQRAERDEKLKLWLELLALIDQHLDPHFDPEEKLFLNIAPPISSTGVALDSGISPRNIKDPDVRLRYEAALEKNGANIGRHNFQSGLRRSDEYISSRAEAYIGAVYVKSPRDAADVSRYVDNYIANKERAARLKSMVMATAY